MKKANVTNVGNEISAYPNGDSVLIADVRYSENLSAQTKILYSEISSLVSVKGYCWETNGYFAKLYSVSNETISRQISDLTKYGFIRVEIVYFENSKQVQERRIYLTSPPIDVNEDTLRENAEEANAFCEKWHSFPVNESFFRQKDTKFYVYILDFGDRVKIGKTKNIDQRIRAIENAAGEKVRQVFYLETDGITEKIIHNYLQEYRTIGEYFTCSFDVAKKTFEYIINENIKYLPK